MFEYLGSFNPFIVVAVILAIIGVIAFLRYQKKRMQTLAVNADNGVKETPKSESDNTDIKQEGQYKAYVWRDDGIHIERIDEKIGNEIMIQPPLPQSGANLFCKLDNSGALVPFEARESVMKEGESPTDCFEAVECSEVEQVYVDFTTLWEKFKALVPYLIAGSEALILLIIVDRLMGGD